jgi:hypothetical protein
MEISCRDVKWKMLQDKMQWPAFVRAGANVRIFLKRQEATVYMLGTVQCLRVLTYTIFTYMVCSKSIEPLVGRNIFIDLEVQNPNPLHSVGGKKFTTAHECPLHFSTDVSLPRFISFRGKKVVSILFEHTSYFFLLPSSDD